MGLFGCTAKGVALRTGIAGLPKDGFFQDKPRAQPCRLFDSCPQHGGEALALGIQGGACYATASEAAVSDL